MNTRIAVSVQPAHHVVVCRLPARARADDDGSAQRELL